MVGKYKVIVLCGSPKFKDQLKFTQYSLTMCGNIVIPIGFWGYSAESPNTKSDLTSLNSWLDSKATAMEAERQQRKNEMLADMHLRKVDMADELFVINIPGCVDTTAQNIIEYALSIGKPITYLGGYERLEN